MNRRILVVDDNFDVRMILSIRFKKIGFEVTTAADGSEGLAALRGHPACCVLLDLMMPTMDGFQFLSALRQHPAPPPVFVVTQSDDAHTQSRAQQLGAGRVFTKTQAFERDFPSMLVRLLEITPAADSARCRSAPLAAAV